MPLPDVLVRIYDADEGTRVLAPENSAKSRCPGRN